MSFTFTWYGHASSMFETSGYKVLVDPFYEDNPGCTISAEQADADFILISHGHFDHVSDAVDVAKRTGALVISNFEITSWFESRGVKTHAQNIGGGYQHPFGYLKFTQALHSSCLPDGTYGGNPLGFLLTNSVGQKIYLACDTGLFGDMGLIGEEGLDLAVLPIGDNFTMGPDDALRAVKLLHPKNVVPIHYNTWGLIAQDADAWARRVAAETGAHVHVLKPGEGYTLA